MSSAPLRKAFLKFFFFFGCGRCCLEMAQIAPHRALTWLSADCSVWLQIESGHARDFVSFCQTVLKTMVWQTQTAFVWRGLSSLKIQVWSRSAVSPSFSIINIKPSYPKWYSMPQHPIHPISQWLYMSWITVGLEMSYHSPIKCHHPVVIRATSCVCWHALTVTSWSHAELCKKDWQGSNVIAIVSRLNMFFVSSLPYCLCVMFISQKGLRIISKLYLACWDTHFHHCDWKRINETLFFWLNKKGRWK